jgi:CDP-diglyceride synthetase
VLVVQPVDLHLGGGQIRRHHEAWLFAAVVLLGFLWEMATFREPGTAVVGLAGVLGDLAESPIKRDRQKKDASQAVPGFGGVLDVVDSVLLAAPVAYWWMRGW